MFPMGGSNFNRNPMLQQAPSFMNYQTQLFGPTQRSSGFGLSGLRPEEARQAQSSELERLRGIQGLQTGAIQQQSLGAQAGQQAMDFQEAQRRRQIEQAIERGPSQIMARNPFEYSGTQDPYQAAISSDYGKELMRQRRLGELELQKAEFEGRAYSGGGFSSWSTPAFPMMGR